MSKDETALDKEALTAACIAGDAEAYSRGMREPPHQVFEAAIRAYLSHASLRTEPVAEPAWASGAKAIVREAHASVTTPLAPTSEAVDPYRNSKPGESWNAAYPVVPVAVKPLEWKKKNSRREDWIADSAVGRYEAGLVHSSFVAMLRIVTGNMPEDIKVGSGLGLEAAKAAAQADYEARIRSALLPAPAREEVLEESYLHARRQAFLDAANTAAGWCNPQALKLAAGEMTAQELRTAQAVAGGIEAAIRSLIGEARALKGAAK